MRRLRLGVDSMDILLRLFLFSLLKLLLIIVLFAPFLFIVLGFFLFVHVLTWEFTIGAVLLGYVGHFRVGCVTLVPLH